MPGSFIEDDLPVFVAEEDFGSLAVHTPAGGSAVSITGIFDDDHVEASTPDGDIVFVKQARFETLTSHGIAVDDTLEIDGCTYKVQVIEDGIGGMTVYHMEKTS